VKSLVFVYRSLLISIVIILSIAITTITIGEQKQYHQQHVAYAAKSSSSSSVLSAEFNFAAAGDWGCTDNTKDTVNNIIDKKPELVVGLGDYSYENTADCWFDIV
jgi:hypothetical protein